MNAQAPGDVVGIRGEPDGLPLEPGATLGDTGTGMLLAISILAALYRRRDTGQGERIEIAMQDAMLQYIRECNYDCMACIIKRLIAWKSCHCQSRNVLGLP